MILNLRKVNTSKYSNQQKFMSIFIEIRFIMPTSICSVWQLSVLRSYPLYTMSVYVRFHCVRLLVFKHTHAKTKVFITYVGLISDLSSRRGYHVSKKRTVFDTFKNDGIYYCFLSSAF